MAEKNYFKALYEVARVINASLSPSEVLNVIVSCVAMTMEAKACSLRLVDSRKKKLLMGAQCGLSAGYIQKGPVIIAESGIDQKALQGESIWIADAQTDSAFQYKEKAKSEGIKSVVVMPLMVEEKTIGVLRVYTAEERQFNEDEMQFLEAVANLSAIALEKARLHQALRNDYELLIEHKYRLDDN